MRPSALPSIAAPSAALYVATANTSRLAANATVFASPVTAPPDVVAVVVPVVCEPPLPGANQGDGVVIESVYFSISCSHTARVVSVVGELDLATASELDKVLSDFEQGPVTVDLSELTFIDAAGMAPLANARTRLGAAGGTLTVVGAKPLVQRLFGITGLGELVTRPKPCS